MSEPLNLRPAEEVIDTMFVPYRKRIAELERENAELRRDAERWQLASTDHRFGIANWCEFGMKASYANHAEEIVDAAIASEKENERG